MLFMLIYCGQPQALMTLSKHTALSTPQALFYLKLNWLRLRRLSALYKEPTKSAQFAKKDDDEDLW